MPRTKYKESVALEYLEAHIQYLGLKTLQEYKEWCQLNGFNRSLDKKPNQLKDEKNLIIRQKAVHQLKQSKNNKWNLDSILNWLDLCKELPWFGTKNKSDSERITPKLSNNYRSLETAVKEIETKNEALAFNRLVRHLLTVSEGIVFENLDNQKHCLIDALINIAKFENDYVRPVETWKPRSHNAYKQFSSLVRHLFVKYTVPSFMDSVWFNKIYTPQYWFVHLGTGHSIKTALDLPVNLTKKQAHYFNQSPKNYNVNGAFRYAQIESLGGDIRLCNALLSTRLCQGFEQDEFWLSVIRWFLANPLLDRNQVAPIIDWIQNQKYERRQVVEEGRIVYLPPIQPNLTMKDRNPNGVMREVEKWHRQLGEMKKSINLVWNSSGIKPFRFEEGQDQSKRVWTIRELLSGRELTIEGKAMSHCVASYAGSCHSGLKSIWSMECQSAKDGFVKHLTIEVSNGLKQIVQARGRFNAKPTQQEYSVIDRWCTKANLEIGKYV